MEHKKWDVLTNDWILHFPVLNGLSDSISSFSTRLGSAWTSSNINGAHIWINSLKNKISGSDSGSLFFVSKGRHRVCLDGLTQRNNALSEEAHDEILQIYTHIQWSQDGKLHISSDLLGLSPVYILKTSYGLLAANKIAHLLTLQPELCFDPDKTAILQYLYFLSPQGNKTLVKGIEVLPADKRLVWSISNGITDIDHRSVAVNYPNPSISLHEAADEIYHLFLSSVEKRFGYIKDPISIAMSGGFDSRLIAGALDRLNIDFSLHSYSSKYHEEHRCAADLSAQLDKKLTSLPTSKDVLHDGEEMFLNVLEGQVDPHIMHIKAIFNSGMPNGHPYGHGFLGDNISGGYLDNLDIRSSTLISELPSRFLKKFNYPAIARLVEHTGLLENKDLLDASLLESIPCTHNVYQSGIMGLMTNRNRRFISAQLRIIDEHYVSILPFLDKELIERWLSLPHMAFNNRVLYRELIAKYFPKLAEVPHPNELLAISPRISSMLKRALRQAPTNFMYQFNSNNIIRIALSRHF